MSNKPISYRFMTENEVLDLKQETLFSLKEIANQYYDLYRKQHNIDTEKQGLYRSFWYLTFLSNIYGEDVSLNLNNALNEKTPAGVRKKVMELVQRHKETMKVLRECEKKGLNARKTSFMTSAPIFYGQDRIFIDIPPANTRAMQCQQIIDWLNLSLPGDELFSLFQQGKTISEKTAKGEKYDRNVTEYRFVKGKKSYRIGKFLSSIAADLEKMKKLFDQHPNIEKEFISYLETEKDFSKKSLFDFKTEVNAKDIYIQEPHLFYQLKSILKSGNSFRFGLDALLNRYKKEASFFQEIETRRLSEAENAETVDMIVLSVRPMDISRKSTFKSWTSCNDIEGRFGSEHALRYIPDELAAYSIVAYGVNKKNPLKPLCRALINPYVNMDDLKLNEMIVEKFYALDRMYGESMPTVRLALESIIDNELNRGFSGSGVYQFKGHSPENCPEYIIFKNGEKVRDLGVFIEMMNQESFSDYHYTVDKNGRFYFDAFELPPDTDVDFNNAYMKELSIPQLTSGITLGEGIEADTVIVRKIHTNKMPRKLNAKRIVFDDASDRAHPDERVSLPQNITASELRVESEHVNEIPDSTNVNTLILNSVDVTNFSVNPIKNLKKIGNISVQDFYCDAGITPELLSNIQVKNMLVIPNYKGDTLPNGIDASSIDVSASQIVKLPQGLKVHDLDVSETKITEFPDNLKVQSSCYAMGCFKLSRIGKNNSFGTLMLEGTDISSLPSDVKIDTAILHGNNRLGYIPHNVQINHLDLKDFFGSVYYSKHYKSIKIDKYSDSLMIDPNIDQNIIKGLTPTQIEYAKKRFIENNSKILSNQSYYFSSKNKTYG